MHARITQARAPLLQAPPTQAGPPPEWVDEVLSGMEVEVLECRGRWRRVRTFYRYEGWLTEECLVCAPGWLARWREGRLGLVWPALAPVQSRPGRGRRVCVLPRGAVVLLPEEGEGPWRRVRLAGGEEGFLPAGSLRPLPAGPPEPTAQVREAVARSALDFLGCPYRWGGKTAFGIDCSGLASLSYLVHGVVIYRDARIQPGFPIHPVPLEELAPGDLLYFPGHMALYLGEGRYVHASGSAGAVVCSTLNPAGPGYRADLAEQITAVGRYL